MLSKTGLYTVSQSEAERIIRARAQQGWRIFRLPADITSKEQFFEGVRRTFPQDPALHSSRSWDALSDSLRASLDGLRDEPIVIVWPSAFRLKAEAPDDFNIATSILADLSASPADAEATAGATKRVLVLQVV